MAKENNKELTPSKPNTGELKIVPIDKLHPFGHHVFKPYKEDDDRFTKLMESIKESGIIQPIIGRRLIKKNVDNGDIEIISGHNRKNAAAKAGKAEIPVIILENLTDEEAKLLANEANIEQRGFNTLLTSEKAKSIDQHHEATKKQGKRSDKSIGTSGGNHQKFDARKETAKIYGIGENVVKMYIRLNKLIEPLKDRLDKKAFALTAASNLSHLSKKVQEIVNSIIEENSEMYVINLKISIDLKETFTDTEDGEIDKDEIRHIMSKKDKSKEISSKSNSDDSININFKLSKDEYDEFFPSEKNDDEISATIKAALMNYRSKI
jgi:ParB family chromosome partitioning protein